MSQTKTLRAYTPKVVSNKRGTFLAVDIYHTDYQLTNEALQSALTAFRCLVATSKRPTPYRTAGCSPCSFHVSGLDPAMYDLVAAGMEFLYRSKAHTEMTVEAKAFGGKS